MLPDEIRQALRRRYAAVSESPIGRFRYPAGRPSVEALRYRSDWAAAIPSSVVDRFVGVGNPFSIGEPGLGERVVDVGCGCGFDARSAAIAVGSEGFVLGFDASPEMLRAARVEPLPRHLEFVQARAEASPLPSDWADLAISNGVLNLSTNKAAAFSEVFRILKPGGRLQAVDLMLVEELPDALRNDRFAWSE